MGCDFQPKGEGPCGLSNLPQPWSSVCLEELQREVGGGVGAVCYSWVLLLQGWSWLRAAEQGRGGGQAPQEQ